MSPKEFATVADAEPALAVLQAEPSFAAVPVPKYLQETYWWAYTHPNAVRVFERQWLVNLILWGNFARLRDAALAEMGRKHEYSRPGDRPALRFERIQKL